MVIGSKIYYNRYGIPSCQYGNTTGGTLASMISLEIPMQVI